MLMQMLGAGGIPLLTDGKRGADEDNPNGYYELDKVMHLRENSAWLAEKGGNAVKVVVPVLRHLPLGLPYSILFLERNLEEVVASQATMLARKGVLPKLSDEKLMKVYANEIERTRLWIGGLARHSLLPLRHGDVIADPAASAQRIADFLGRPLDVQRMASVVDRRYVRANRPKQSGVGVI